MLYSYVTLSFPRLQTKLKVHFPPKDLKSLMMDASKMTNTQTKHMWFIQQSKTKAAKTRGKKHYIISLSSSFLALLACLPSHVTIIYVLVQLSSTKATTLNLKT